MGEEGLGASAHHSAELHMPVTGPVQAAEQSKGPRQQVPQADPSTLAQSAADTPTGEDRPRSKVMSWAACVLGSLFSYAA